MVVSESLDEACISVAHLTIIEINNPLNTFKISMKKAVIFSIFILLGFSSFAQTNIPAPKRPWQIHHFSFQTQAGLNKGLIQKIGGDNHLTTFRTFTPSAILQYNYRLSKSFGLYANVGYGSISYSFDDEDYYRSPMVDFWRLIGTQKMSFGVEYSYFFEKNYAISTSVGYSVFNINQIGISTGASGVDENGNSIDKWRAERRSDLGEEVGGLFDLNLTLSRLLPNGDFIDFTVGNRFGVRDALIFRYDFLQNTPDYSAGLFINRGSEFYVGLGYSFLNTGKKHKMDIARLRNNKKEARKERKVSLEKARKEKQKIKASIGFNGLMENVTENDLILGGWSNPGVSLMLETSKSMGKIDFNGGFVFNDYWTSTRYYSRPYGVSSTGLGQTIQMNIGASKAITNRRKSVRFGEIKAGMAIAGGRFGGGSSGSSSGQQSIEAIYPDRIVVYPLAYAGFETSIRLYNQLYFVFDFTYYQGMIRAYQFDREITINGNEPYTINQKTNGSNYIFGTGLSFYL